LSGFIGSGGDWRAFVLAIICAVVAFLIWFPFIKMYDGKLYKDEQANATKA
nr:PTS cellobiose transporter subunit IIC [Enterococcus sp.]